MLDEMISSSVSMESREISGTRSPSPVSSASLARKAAPIDRIQTNRGFTHRRSRRRLSRNSMRSSMAALHDFEPEPHYNVIATEIRQETPSHTEPRRAKVLRGPRHKGQELMKGAESNKLPAELPPTALETPDPLHWLRRVVLFVGGQTVSLFGSM